MSEDIKTAALWLVAAEDAKAKNAELIERFCVGMAFMFATFEKLDTRPADLEPVLVNMVTSDNDVARHLTEKFSTDFPKAQDALPIAEKVCRAYTYGLLESGLAHPILFQPRSTPEVITSEDLDKARTRPEQIANIHLLAADNLKR